MQRQYSPDELCERLAYDADRGILIWKKCRDSNKIGKVAMALDVAGYVQVNIAGTVLKGHRIAWAIHYGKWPDGPIDHLNGIRCDNRIENLRSVTHQVNCQNMRNGSCKNQTGYIGVHVGRGDSSKRYRAKIQFNGKQIHLGGFPTPELAHAAYVAEKRKLHVGNTL